MRLYIVHCMASWLLRTARSHETVISGEQWERSQWLSLTMTVTFRVFKKSSTNGAVTIYLGRRDFVDHVTRWVVRRLVRLRSIIIFHPQL